MLLSTSHLQTTISSNLQPPGLLLNHWYGEWGQVKAAKAFFFGLLWLVNLLQILLGGQQQGVWRARAPENLAASLRRAGGRPSHTPSVCVVG
jgi:hypothetical protein